MEMIIAILFFSLASAVCIQLFAKSHLLSTQTVNQNHAVKSKSECIVADLFRRREQILHGIYVTLQREVRFRQILCLDDSMVLIYF